MNKITVTGRVLYGTAIAATGIQQLYYADFCPMLFPHWPNPIPGYTLLAFLFSAAIITAGIAIITGKYAVITALVLGGVLLLMLLLGQVPYEYVVIPYKKTHLAIWQLPLKELALAGGAFCIAGSCTATHEQHLHTFRIVRILKKCIPLGPVFFSTTMICFGITHFLYTQTVADMIPSWIPAHYFWAYFTAVALIAAGFAIITGAWRGRAALLLGIMIFLWFVFLHLPGAIKYPLLDRGNLVYSAFSALAFSGIALVIAGNDYTKQMIIHNEKNI